MSASPPESTRVSKTASAPPPKGGGAKGRPPPATGRKNPLAEPSSSGGETLPSNSHPPPSSKKPPTPSTKPSPGPTPTNSTTPRGNNDDATDRASTTGRRTPPPPPAKASGKAPFPTGVKGGSNPPPKRSLGDSDVTSEAGSTTSSRPAPPPKGKGMKSAGLPPPRHTDGSPRMSPRDSPKAQEGGMTDPDKGDSGPHPKPGPKVGSKAPMPKPAPQRSGDRGSGGQLPGDQTSPPEPTAHQRTSPKHEDESHSASVPPQQQQQKDSFSERDPSQKAESQCRKGSPDAQESTLPPTSDPPSKEPPGGDAQTDHDDAGGGSNETASTIEPTQTTKHSGDQQNTQQEGTVFQPAATASHQPPQQQQQQQQQQPSEVSCSSNEPMRGPPPRGQRDELNKGSNRQHDDSPPKPEPVESNPKPHAIPPQKSSGSNNNTKQPHETNPPATAPVPSPAKKKPPAKGAPSPKSSHTATSTPSNAEPTEDGTTMSLAESSRPDRAQSEEISTQTPVSPTRQREEESRAETERLREKISQVQSELDRLREEKETWQRKSEIQQQADNDAFVDRATQMSAEYSRHTPTHVNSSEDPVSREESEQRPQHEGGNNYNQSPPPQASTMMQPPHQYSYSPTPHEPMLDQYENAPSPHSLAGGQEHSGLQFKGNEIDDHQGAVGENSQRGISINASSHATYYYLKRMEEMRRVTDLAASETPTSIRGGEDGMNSSLPRDGSPFLTGPSPSAAPASSRLPPPPERTPGASPSRQNQLTFAPSGVPKREVLAPHAYYTGGGLVEKSEEDIYDQEAGGVGDIRPVERAEGPVYHTLSPSGAGGGGGSSQTSYFSGGTHYHLLGSGGVQHPTSSFQDLVPVPGEGLSAGGSATPPRYYDQDLRTTGQSSSSHREEGGERVVVEGGQVHRILAPGDIPAQQAAQEVLWVPSTEVHTRDERQKYSSDPLRTKKVLQGFFRENPVQRTTSPFHQSSFQYRSSSSGDLPPMADEGRLRSPPRPHPATDLSSARNVGGVTTSSTPGSAYNVAATMLDGESSMVVPLGSVSSRRYGYDRDGEQYQTSLRPTESPNRYAVSSATTAYYTPGGSHRVPNVTSSHHRDRHEAGAVNDRAGYSRNMVSFRSPRVHY